jgi:hypothetical protein
MIYTPSRKATAGIRERVLAVSQTPEGIAAKKRWDETVHGWEPAPGWTIRLRDIRHPLGIDAVAVGKILNLMGIRGGKRGRDQVGAAGCGVRRWDGYCFHLGWHCDRFVEAIKSSGGRPE